MHPLDVLSDSPRLFILQKESNETNFGGVLFLLCLVVVVVIIIYYIIDCVENDKYVIQSFSHFNIKTKKEQDKMNEDILFNPDINFKINLAIDNRGKIQEINDEPFFLIDNNNFNLHIIFSRNSLFNRRISEFDISVIYECKEDNCSEYYTFLENIKDEYGLKELKYYLNIEYDDSLYYIKMKINQF